MRAAPATPDPARAADLALSLTPGQLMPRGRRKRILRAVPARRFPPDVTRRPKSGFAFPIGELLRTDPRAAAACRGLLLAPDALAGLPTDRAAVARVWTSTPGRADRAPATPSGSLPSARWRCGRGG